MRLWWLIVFFLPFAAQAVEVKEVKTPGGLTAWLVQDKSLPLLSMQLAFRDAGASADPAGKEGRSALTAALLMEGTKKYTAREFSEQLDAHAIRLSIGADMDLFTANMKTLSEHREKAFELLSQALTAPRFAPEAVSRVRAQALAVLQAQEQNPNYALERAFSQRLFGAHVYARPENGSKASLGALTQQDFTNVTKRLLTKENLIISVAGDMDEATLSTLLDRSLGTLPAHFAPEKPVAAVTPTIQGAPDVIARDIPQTLVSFAAPGVARSDKDYMAAFVMNHLLGGAGLNSRLSKEIREKRGLTYGIATNVQPMLHASVWAGGFSTRNEQAWSAWVATRALIDDFAKNGPTDAELTDAKNYLTGSFVLNLDSNDELASYLISMQLYGLGRDYLATRNAQIDVVQVEDIKRVAARIFADKQLALVMVGGVKKP